MPRPDEPAAQRALEEVEAALEQAGWLETGRGGEWFTRQFERIGVVTAPAAPVPAVESEAPQPVLLAPEPVLPAAPPQAPAPAYAADPVLPVAPAPVPPPAPAVRFRAKDRDGRGWQIAAVAALPAALALLGWLVAGGG